MLKKLRVIFTVPRYKEQYYVDGVGYCQKHTQTASSVNVALELFKCHIFIRVFFK